MNLKGVNVLIDGYNLELREGTGVKTYGITLIKALATLGCNVNVLFSLNKRKSKDALLKEVLFYDIEDALPYSKLKIFISLAKITCGIPFLSQKLDISNVVIKPYDYLPLENTLGIYNIPSCFSMANLVFKKFKINMKIKPENKINIWHCTYPLPINIKGTKKVTTIHDLVPLRLPYTTLDNKKVFYNLIKNSLKDSSAIITVSENSKRDILNIFNINPNKIYVTYPYVDLQSMSEDEEMISNLLNKYHLKYKRYILFVGAIEPKKNVGRLINAYLLLNTDLPLVIAGKKGWLWEDEILKPLRVANRNKNLRKKIIFLHYLHVYTLKYLYSGAYCLVFPSLYEGFGLPPLEAMTLGCPVITSNVASLPEVCGDAALYVDPYDIKDIAEKMELLLNDKNLRDNLSKAGKERAKFFGMENYAKRLYEAYSHIL